MFAVLITFSMLVLSACGSEMHCSPYHFVEQTLTKVIQVEMMVQKMKEDMAAMQQKVLDKLQEMDTFKQQFKHDFDTEIETVKNNYKDMNEVGKTQVEQIKDYLEPILFSAKEVTNKSPTSNERLVFSTTMMNKGDGYDTSSGIFTAPVNGVYLFTLQLCVGAGSYPYYAITVNDKNVQRGFFYDKNINSCHTADATSVLSKGDRVWITITYQGKLLQGTDHWNTFSGVLVQKTV